MRLMAALLSASLTGLSLAAPAQDQAQAPAEAPALSALIPAKSFPASLMRLAFDKSASEISKRFNEALEKSPEWLQAYIADNAGVKPLPYHPNFGISKEDYGIMLQSFERKRLEPISEVAVQVAKLPDGTLSLECPQMSGTFAGIKLNPATGRLTTPYMEIQSPASRDSELEKDPGNPFGAWKGLSWKGVEQSKEKELYKSVSFIAGRAASGGAAFIAYRVKVMEEGKITKNFEVVLKFAAPRL